MDEKHDIYIKVQSDLNNKGINVTLEQVKFVYQTEIKYLKDGINRKKETIFPYFGKFKINDMICSARELLKKLREQGATKEEIQIEMKKNRDLLMNKYIKTKRNYSYLISKNKYKPTVYELS